MNEIEDRKPVETLAVTLNNMILLPEKEVRKRRGNRSSSSQANDVREGTFIIPVKLGGGAKLKFYPDHEVDILIAQEVAGASKEEKRKLVRLLMKARTEHFNSLASQYKVAA